jgi:hypothetical protein
MSSSPISQPHGLSPVQPLEVAERCWRSATAIRHRCCAARTCGGFPARAGTSVCVDPAHNSIIGHRGKSQRILGDGRLDFITVNHQDPDVTGLPSLCEGHPAATVI